MEEPARQSRRNARIVAGLAYAGAAGLSLLSAIWLLDLHEASLRVPFEYRGDALYYSSAIKSIVDHGWFWTNSHLAAPGGLELYDYPNLAHESFHLLIIKLMSLFSGDWALLLNVYFLAGFPLITVAAMAAFRRLGLGRAAAAAGGILYAFLPSRLIKGEAHIFLDSFYQVPLAVLVLVWVCGEAPPFWEPPGDPATPDGRWSRRRLIRTAFAAGVCALSASMSSYYAFFTACLLVVGGVWASAQRRSSRNAISAGILATIIVAGMALNGLPSIIHQSRSGPNPEVGHRSPQEAELYGLRITQLLLPTTEHRIHALRQLKWEYDTTAPFVGESGLTTLGIVGSIGFLCLFGALLVPRQRKSVSDDVIRAFAVLNVAAVLLGTIGGFGSLISYLGLPQIRAYSRLVVFIAFFSLFPVLLALDRLNRARPIAGWTAIGLVLAIGLFDQVTPAATRAYPLVRREFVSDRNIVHRIEQLVAPQEIVFELPYVSFPEGAPRGNVSSYDWLRPYLHSSTLRWSLPTMRGRGDDAFVRDTAELAPDSMLETLAQIGYAGVLIQRAGYADKGTAVEAGLGSVLQAAPVVSEDGRFSFFSLAEYRQRAPAKLPAEEIVRRLYPLAVTFNPGFSGVEHDGVKDFHWCDRRGEVVIESRAPFTRRALLRATFVGARPPGTLTIAGDLLSRRLDLATPVPFAQAIDIPPGRHVIRFESNGKPAVVPSDPRTLVWRIEGFMLDESLEP